MYLLAQTSVSLKEFILNAFIYLFIKCNVRSVLLTNAN